MSNTNYPTLNFPPIHLRARRGQNGRTEVFDAARGRWLVLTPEEWVRRHVVEHLRTSCGFTPQQIIEEYPVEINGMAQRADIVVVDSLGKNFVVVECKEPKVKIDNVVLAQAIRYNSILGCRHIVITNGLSTYCYDMSDDGKYTPSNHFPTAK
jgi:predicted type IV restriction endonuclease